jgi:branched-chain amino acid transport system substrate-binding protein
MSRAVDMAVADYGDIHGHSVNVGTWYDDLCSSTGGRNAARQIIADRRVVGVLGTSCSGAATAAAPLITDAGMVLISGSNSSPALTSDMEGTASDNWSEGYYRTSLNDLVQGFAMAVYVFEELDAKTVATIDDGDPYTMDLVDAFSRVFTDLGGEVTIRKTVSRGQTDMSRILTDIARQPPDVIYMPIFPPEGNDIAQQIFDFPELYLSWVATADGMLVDNFMEMPESEFTLMSAPSLNFVSRNELTGKTPNDVLREYQREYGEAPSTAFWAHAYDATTLLLSAIEAASYKQGPSSTLVVDLAGIREWLNGTINIRGLTGNLGCGIPFFARDSLNTVIEAIMELGAAADTYGDCGANNVLIIQHTDHRNIEEGKNNVMFEFGAG